MKKLFYDLSENQFIPFLSINRFVTKKMWNAQGEKWKKINPKHCLFELDWIELMNVNFKWTFSIMKSHMLIFQIKQIILFECPLIVRTQSKLNNLMSKFTGIQQMWKIQIATHSSFIFGYLWTIKNICRKFSLEWRQLQLS